MTTNKPKDRPRGRPSLGHDEALGKGHSPTRAVCLTPELDQALTDYAKQTGRTKSDIIREALAEKLDQAMNNKEGGTK